MDPLGSNARRNLPAWHFCASPIQSYTVTALPLSQLLVFPHTASVVLVHALTTFPWGHTVHVAHTPSLTPSHPLCKNLLAVHATQALHWVAPIPS
jgi:hypothetical protein